MLMSLKDISIDISKCDNTSNYVFSHVEPCELEDLQIESPIVGEGTYGEYNLTVIYHPLISKEPHYNQFCVSRHLVGIQTEIKPYSIAMELNCWTWNTINDRAQVII